MSRTKLTERIKQGLFLLDGGMGTQLICRGVEVGRCNESLNLDSAELIRQIHIDYLQAGSDAVLTNTFGGNKFALSRRQLDKQVRRVNMAAAGIARQAAGQDKYVFGDIGPSGEFLEPIGDKKPQQLKEAFQEQADALVEGGVDGILIETFSALEEITVAIDAAKSVASEIPVFASMAFEDNNGSFRTMMGVSIEQAVQTINSAGAEAVGFNCGKADMPGYIKLAAGYKTVADKLNKDIVLFAEPNAGQPELVQDNVVYKVDAQDFARAAEKIYQTGVRIIGGCCGTTPGHIEAMSALLKKQ